MGAAAYAVVKRGQARVGMQDGGQYGMYMQHMQAGMKQDGWSAVVSVAARQVLTVKLLYPLFWLAKKP
jgi:hypothetical protein